MGPGKVGTTSCEDERKPDRGSTFLVPQDIKIMMAACFCEQAKSNKFHGDPLVNSSTNVFFEARSGQFFVLFVVFSSFSLFSLVYILQRFFVAFFSLLELSPLVFQ